VACALHKRPSPWVGRRFLITTVDELLMGLIQNARSINRLERRPMECISAHLTPDHPNGCYPDADLLLTIASTWVIAAFRTWKQIFAVSGVGLKPDLACALGCMKLR
jgi:hypothetical protein